MEKIENSFAAVAYPSVRADHPSATKAEAGAKDENIHPDQGKRTISLRGARPPHTIPVFRTKNFQ